MFLLHNCESYKVYNENISQPDKRNLKKNCIQIIKIISNRKEYYQMFGANLCWSLYQVGWASDYRPKDQYLSCAMHSKIKKIYIKRKITGVKKCSL